ncbi:beta-glucosidase BglX [Plebeiibacterium marinum]|uniref:Periplasmic beta-glucosidase n=1 Tax=Plebeiibacterium marinum TaxID=2992111 RepID=A0AAE3SID3_9BACT|nr:beta-glucosidase BglX [Plebeiobacterium marinum]MCW3804502.1 beta-glucosidase BglX [Plebeiobacterium marinum]
MKLFRFKVLGFALIFACLWSCSSSDTTTKTDEAMDQYVTELVDKMTLDEKLGQLNLLAWDGSLTTGAAANTGVSQKVEKGLVGGLFNIESQQERRKIQELVIKQSRLGIPLMFGQDVIHGHHTVFPIPLALSCSWDMDLIEKTARAAAYEASADGIDWVFSPMVDISKDPRWGRVAEGAGEDVYLGSMVAKAMVKGYQGADMASDESVMACVKHYALYGAAEAGRDYNTVDMSVLRMFQDYLPPYQAAVDAGVGSVMTSFNDINGVPATSNKWLIEDILRNYWGFNGFVVTDYTAIREMGFHGVGDLKTSSALAIDAGIDMDMVSEGFVHTLQSSLEEGKVSMETIDKACKRVLEAKYKLGLFKDPYIRLKKDKVDSQKQKELMDLALLAAQKSCVLLKNKDNILPFKSDQSVAVIGPLADCKKDLLGTWVLSGELDQVQSIKEAVQQKGNILYAEGAKLTDNEDIAKLINYNTKGEDDEALLKKAVLTAKKADVVVAVLGESAAMSGEASSMADISLQATQQKLLKALVKTGKPVVLVLVSGRPMTLEWEAENCAAILQCWAGGTQTAPAVSGILWGDYNPSGKLTMSFPRKVGQIPVYYNMKNTGRPFYPGIKYTSRYLDVSNKPLFPFGYGLSYTSFEYGDLVIKDNIMDQGDTITVSVTMKNTGEYAGEETAQLYIRDMEASITRPLKELKGFKKVYLQPGEEKTIEFEITEDDLKFYNKNLEYKVEPGEFQIEVGSDSENIKASKIHYQL